MHNSSLVAYRSRNIFDAYKVTKLLYGNQQKFNIEL